MTREEALKKIKDEIRMYDEESLESVEWKECYEALNDTVSRGVLEQVMWERDIAIEQLRKLGYELGQKIEPCDDAISRQAVLDVINTAWTIDDLNNLTNAMLTDMIKTLPPVAPQQKYGKWIKHPEIETSTPEYLMFYECSECGDKQCFYKSDLHKKRFCNSCGAKMESEVRNEV